MGAGKSKPKEPGQRSMSLDGTIGTGSDSGHFHHLGPVQQTQTPNRSPAVGTGRRGHQGQHQQAPTNTPELALFGGVSMGTITSPQRGPLSGKHSNKIWALHTMVLLEFIGLGLGYISTVAKEKHFAQPWNPPSKSNKDLLFVLSLMSLSERVKALRTPTVRSLNGDYVDKQSWDALSLV